MIQAVRERMGHLYPGPNFVIWKVFKKLSQTEKVTKHGKST